MSTLQHINSSLDHFWPEYQRRFPAFDKPEIVPAETLRGMAPVYMRRLIDQDPSSYYLFVHADPMRGDASRDRMVEFVDDFFYNKLGMPSSYDVEAGQGGDLPREQAVDKEVMPARDDREYQRYFDEQMAAAEAQRREQERQKRIDDLGFDPDDPDIIDAEIGDDGVVRPVQGAADTKAVGQAQTTAVGMPKKIWFCVDFHCPAGGMLGYDGNSGRLGGRGGRRFLREAHTDNPVGDIFKAYTWANGKNLCKGMVSIAKASPAPGASDSNRELHDKYNLFIVKYSDGTFLWIQESADSGSFSIAQPKMDAARAAHWAKIYDVGDMLVATAVELEAYSLFSENEKSDPEEMMKEFVEKKENGEVEEDEYRRPKNQPHNLHRVDEKDDGEKAEDCGESDEDEAEDGGKAEDESEELNESMIRFCDRLIRG